MFSTRFRVFPKVRSVLSQCNTRLRLLHLLYRGNVKNNKTRLFYVLNSDKTWVFDQLEREPGRIYILSISITDLCVRLLWANLCWRHCLHFCSLAYDLPNRSSGRIYELNAKVERADSVEQFVQFSALCKQYWRKYQTSKTAKLLGGKKVNEPYIPCKIWSF